MFSTVLQQVVDHVQLLMGQAPPGIRVRVRVRGEVRGRVKVRVCVSYRVGLGSGYSFLNFS